MKRLLVVISILLITSAGSLAQRRSSGITRSSRSTTSTSPRPREVHVKGYWKKDGTYVAPHVRTAPDGDFYNNWSTKGNINPYTGREGTRVTPPNGYGGIRSTRSIESSPAVTYDFNNAAEQTNSSGLTPPAQSPSQRYTSTQSSNTSASLNPQIEIAVVIRQKANLRDSPNQFSNVIQEVSEGNAVVLLNERTGGWYKVTDVITGKQGWIHGNTIRIAFVK